MLYLVTFSIILCVPYDLSIFIKKGLEDRKGQIVSLLAVDLTTRSKLGAIFNIQRQSGYERFYSILKANVYMLINPSSYNRTESNHSHTHSNRYTGLSNKTIINLQTRPSLYSIFLYPCSLRI
jgi:hypothetical protein